VFHGWRMSKLVWCFIWDFALSYSNAHETRPFATSYMGFLVPTGRLLPIYKMTPCYHQGHGR
jgi:hypothetical protein